MLAKRIQNLGKFLDDRQYEYQKSVLENIFERCLNDGIIPILCTTDLKSDDILEKIAEENNIKIFRGSNKNKIKRWFECAKYFDIDFFHIDLSG